jgi:hypothetical protein
MPVVKSKFRLFSASYETPYRREELHPSISLCVSYDPLVCPWEKVVCLIDFTKHSEQSEKREFIKERWELNSLLISILVFNALPGNTVKYCSSEKILCVSSCDYKGSLLSFGTDGSLIIYSFQVIPKSPGPWQNIVAIAREIDEIPPADMRVSSSTSDQAWRRQSRIAVEPQVFFYISTWMTM